MLGDSDDRAGSVFMGLLITFGSVIIAMAAAMFERILQNAVELRGGQFTWSETTVLARN